MAEEKYKENKMNFEGAYLKNHWTDLAQFWNRRCLTPRDFSQKRGYCNGQPAITWYDGVKNETNVFLVSVNTHLSVVCPNALAT